MDSEEHNSEAIAVQFAPNSPGCTEHAHAEKFQ